MFIKKFESFNSNNILLGDGISNLDFIKPYLYDNQKLDGIKTDIWRLEARLDKKTIGFCSYFELEDGKNYWKSHLLSVSTPYREDPLYKNLSILIRLLTFGSIGRPTAISQDLSNSGSGFVKKWEREGIWTLGELSQTLTDVGKKESQKFSKKFLGINRLNWV
jgi:hypothetical protein